MGFIRSSEQVKPRPTPVPLGFMKERTPRRGLHGAPQWACPWHVALSRQATRLSWDPWDPGGRCLHQVLRRLTWSQGFCFNIRMKPQ